MKIYFSGSVSGGRDNVLVYKEIIKMLKVYGEVLTEHLGDTKLTKEGYSDQTNEYVFSTDTSNVERADVLVAEVSTPSLGVGYEVGITEKLGKPMLCIYKNKEGRPTSAMILGNPKITSHGYDTIDEVQSILRDFFKDML